MALKKSMSIYCLSICLLGGCSQEEPKDDNKFVQHVSLKRSCYENHVKQPAQYSGSLVHWHNLTKNTHSYYGSVHHDEALSHENLMRTIERPYEYTPPFIVSFWEVPPSEFSKQELVLEGISEHVAKDGRSEGPQYKATCNLVAIERLDYLPSLREKN